MIRWRTEEEKDQAISDETIEDTSPRVCFVHPGQISQCFFRTSEPGFEKTLAKCPHYERDWEYDPEEDMHCCCRHFWGTGWDGLCEMAVIKPEECVQE